MSNISPKDLIYYSDNEGKIYSGGFSVNSIMLKEGLSPILTLNNISQSDGHNNVTDLFSDLVIPSWSLYHPEHSSNSYFNTTNIDDNESDSENSNDYIEDDLYNKLLGLVSVSENELRGGKKNTKKMRQKNKINKNKKTRRKN